MCLRILLTRQTLFSWRHRRSLYGYVFAGVVEYLIPEMYLEESDAPLCRLPPSYCCDVA